MKLGRKRWLVRMAIVLIAALAALLWFVGERPHDLSVENHSGQPIASLKITVAGQTSTFRDVKDGTEVSAPYRARNGDHCSMEGQLADGTRIRFMGAIGERMQFLVLPGGQIAQKKAREN
jgi:hypothetical protein